MTSRVTIWGSPSVRHLFGRPSERLPFPLEEPDCRLYSRARDALWRGVQQIGLQEGDEVLAPAFHHGSEIEALLRAGLECRFYEVGDSLAPDPAELESLVGPRTRALLLIHYLGRPQAAARWRGWCDERELLLLEDAAQSWLATSDGQPVGSRGDLAIFCLYKTLPIPDGSALICAPAPPEPSRHELGLASWARDAVQHSPVVTRVGRRLRRGRSDRVHDEFALGRPDTAPAWVSSRMLPRLVDPSIPSRRTANYEVLAGELESFVQPPFDALPAGSSPMLLPLSLEAEHKHDVLDRLAADAIEGVDFWSVPHPTLPVEAFPRSAALRDTVVGVPVHQGLDAGDLRRIVQAVRGG